jgi:hypothetical protein
VLSSHWQMLSKNMVNGRSKDPFEELAQNGVRREAAPGRPCGARRTLCATKSL